MSAQLRLSQRTVSSLVMRYALFAFSLLFIGAASADTLVGRVVRVSDGDTLTVLVAEHQIRVRLLEIDAPESKQAFGKRSRRSLAELCAGKTAQITWTQSDRYGRTLGRVFCNGVDANAEQVRRGMAWVFDRYVTDRSLYALQDKARTAHLGLWSDQHPIPPWIWRDRERQKAKSF